MKKIIPFLFTLILFSCSDKKESIPVAEPVPKFDTLVVGKQTYFMQNLSDTNYIFPPVIMRLDSDFTQIAGYSNLAQRTGDSLFLKCDNGKTVQLINNLSQDDNYIQFCFIELNKDIEHYLVSCLRVESSNYILVNKKNGNRIEAIGPPVTSPDKNFFVCGHSDLVAQFNLNGIEIYKKNKNSYHLLGVRELANWGPEQMMWKNDSSLMIKANLLKADNTTQENVYKILFIK